MTHYLFGEEVLREDRRKGSYFVRYIPFLIIFAALAAAPWILPRYVPKAAEILFSLQTYIPNPTVIKAIVCAVFAIIFVLILICGIRSLKIPRLIITGKRVCLIKRRKNYHEVRIDLIDSFKVRGNKISVYAGGRKVISFGPVIDTVATRDTIVLLINGEYTGEPSDSHQGRPSDYGEPESISKSGDVFDGE